MVVGSFMPVCAQGWLPRGSPPWWTGACKVFPARADTKFHAMALEFLRHVLEEKGLLSSADRTYGSCLIDDASFATRWADRLTDWPGFFFLAGSCQHVVLGWAPIKFT